MRKGRIEFYYRKWRRIPFTKEYELVIQPTWFRVMNRVSKLIKCGATINMKHVIYHNNPELHSVYDGVVIEYSHDN